MKIKNEELLKRNELCRRFVAECCRESGDETSSLSLRIAFQKWAEKNNEPDIRSSLKFNRSIVSLGFVGFQKSGTSHFRGISLIESVGENPPDLDKCKRFLSECCVNPGTQVRSRDLFSAYESWGKKHGYRTSTRRAFGLLMTQLNFERFHRNGIWYDGLHLIESTEPKIEG